MLALEHSRSCFLFHNSILSLRLLLQLRTAPSQTSFLRRSTAQFNGGASPFSATFSKTWNGFNRLFVSPTTSIFPNPQNFENLLEYVVESFNQTRGRNQPDYLPLLGNAELHISRASCKPSGLLVAAKPSGLSLASFWGNGFRIKDVLSLITQEILSGFDLMYKQHLDSKDKRFRGDGIGSIDKIVYIN